MEWRYRLQCKYSWASSWPRGTISSVRAVLGTETMHPANYKVNDSGMLAVWSNWAKVVTRC